MIITYELVGYDKLLPEELFFKEQIDNAFKVAIKYFHDLIKIIPKDRKYSRYEEEKYIDGKSKKCFMAEITV